MSAVLDLLVTKAHTKKTRIISVGLSCYDVEINNLFVLLIHQVPEILHLMTFHDLRTTAILDVDLQTRK